MVLRGHSNFTNFTAKNLTTIIFILKFNAGLFCNVFTITLYGILVHGDLYIFAILYITSLHYFIHTCISPHLLFSQLSIQ